MPLPGPRLKSRRCPSTNRTSTRNPFSSYSFTRPLILQPWYVYLPVLQILIADVLQNYVSQSSHVLVGSPHVYTSTNADLRSRFNLPPDVGSSPILLAIKGNSPYTYTSHLPIVLSSSSASQKQVEDWLIRNRLPTVLALTQETFQDVMNAPHAPLVVLAAVPPTQTERAKEVLEGVARAYRQRAGAAGEKDVVFTYMDSEKWASWMKSMYGIRAANGPAVVIADHKVRPSYLFSRTGITG